MQKTLDGYGAGVLIQQVQMQKVDPPQQVIDSFRDVQAAQADAQRLQNEAQTYSNRVIPDATVAPRRFCKARKATSSRQWPRPRARPRAS